MTLNLLSSHTEPQESRVVGVMNYHGSRVSEKHFLICPLRVLDDGWNIRTHCRSDTDWVPLMGHLPVGDLDRRLCLGSAESDLPPRALKG